MRMETISQLIGLLRCLSCGSPLTITEFTEVASYPELGVDGWLSCTGCEESYPIIGGTPRMLLADARAELAHQYPRAAESLGLAHDTAAVARDAEAEIKRRTSDSFAYEWEHFGSPRPEWQQNFIDYMRPLTEDFFRGRRVLDVGAGSGRHSAYATILGAEVVAVDRGRTIDVARRNLPAAALTVQADAERLPFETEIFDLVVSIGVLHHLSDTERALRSIARYAKVDGRVHIYLYWVPERASHRIVLKLVTAARQLTVKLPHGLLHKLCYPLSILLWLGVVLPYRAVRSRPQMSKVASVFPLKTYADYPFGVLVNDQFDRFSAPIERRFTRTEVQMMLERSSLVDVIILPNHGWVADGIRPAEQLPGS